MQRVATPVETDKRAQKLASGLCYWQWSFLDSQLADAVFSSVGDFLFGAGQPFAAAIFVSHCAGAIAVSRGIFMFASA